MPEECEALTGRCLCGAVTLTVRPANCDIEVCHCTMCQRWGGGPLFCLHALPDDAISVTGEGNVRRFPSSDWAERAFCGTCGSNLWYRLVPAGVRTIAAGLFDLPESFAVTQQIFIEERPEWARLAANTVKKTGAEVFAEAKAAGFAPD